MAERESLPVRLEAARDSEQHNSGGSWWENAEIFLKRGEITASQPIYNGSNSVFLLTLTYRNETANAIYKPRRGEAPLWDFADGTLYQREYAAYIASRALGWDFVPPTIIRKGNYGIGMVQWFIDTQHTSSAEEPEENWAAELKKVAIFDWLLNNADRKAGHCLLDRDGKLWLIDHGLTFHEDPKLRTIIWDFIGQPVPQELLIDLKQFGKKLDNNTDELTEALSAILSDAEMHALNARLKLILTEAVYPASFGSNRRIPWPPY